MSDVAHVPAVKVGGVADALPMTEPVAMFAHVASSLEDTVADPTCWEHASSLYTLTVAEQESPVGVPHVHVHELSSS